MENFNTIENLKKYKHIHMLGIGGISMSGIAEILHHWGFFVTGSDCTRTKITDRLSSHGIYVSIGQSNLIDNADLVIYSAAIKENDPELVIAKAKGIHSIERCDFVGFLTRIFNDTIGISGTHGKTTTTSMVSLCFMEAGFDPTIQVGAILNDINGNYRVGNSDYFILEACEYVESFLKFSPKSAIVLNIDNDHLDYFKDFEHIKSAFSKYVDLLPREGLLVINGDDESCLDLRKSTSAKTITYGINNEKANFVARNITINDFGCHKFDVYYNNRFYSEIKLSVPGIHNVSNALACIALCNAYGISKGDIKYALSKFKGASRRFEYVGSYNNIDVYDDYAHHPQEIKATSEALKNKKHRQSWVVFQPHTYSRTVSLLKDFAQSLLDFDNIIITDIYAAREKNTYNISSQDLVSEIKKLGKNAVYISSFEDITRYIKERACPNDIILTMGAGTVVDISKMMLN
ncbi:MAG: UDP-N-acetylmuramate--L-alanine ligase [Clostridia bacterium]|nr:UDP-N-acetylmuramate--L-alanine ligase [Clostridia bacterium]